MSKFLVTNKIKTETDLMVIAKQWNGNGKYIYNFIMNKDSKALPDLIHTTRKTENAAKVKERASKLTDRGFEGTTDLDLC